MADTATLVANLGVVTLMPSILVPRPKGCW